MIHDLVRHLREVPRTIPVVNEDESLGKKLDQFLAGNWTVSDLVEMHMDELSTAVAVGSGTERPLGTEEEEKRRKMQERLSEWCQKESVSPTGANIRRFFDEVFPGISEETIAEFRKGIR